MTKRLYAMIMTVLCLISVGAGEAQEEDSKALKRNVRKAFQITSAVFSTAGTVRLMRCFQQWDKFFLTPQLGMVPTNIEQHIAQADRKKCKDRCIDIMILGLSGNMYTALPTLTKQDGIFLPVALTMHTLYGVFISAAHLKMIYDMINRRFISPQRGLIAEACISCDQESREADLLIPCGDAGHPICVECYSDAIEWADHYQCPSCTKVIPAQEITIRPLSLYDKICHLSAADKSRIRNIILWQCAVFVLLYLSLERALDS